jgi:hypothetical protein
MCRSQASVPASVYDQAWQEAFRHKWIESEKHGRDLGPAAIKDWNERHFKRCCHWCHWLHLTGRQCYREFPQHQFNTVANPCDDVEQQVVQQYWDGQENLDIYWCAHGSGWPIERVSAVLTKLGINEARLSPPVT